jgi:hypothetical protein
MPFLELEGMPDIEDNPRELNGELVVGSGSQATWRLPGRDLAARHFRVHTQSDGARVVPASAQNIVVLNDAQAPTEGATLSSGDVIAAGSARFVFLEEKSSPRPEPLGDPSPSYLIDSTARRAYSLRKRVVQIGREIGCSIVLKDPTVSRFHSDVKSEGGQFVIYSMGSTGTRVNDAPVSTPRMLVEGDRIAVGDTTFTFTRRALPPGISLVQFEDHVDDSFSRRNTVLLDRVITSESRKYTRGTKRARNPLIPWLIGLGAVVALFVAFIALKR